MSQCCTLYPFSLKKTLKNMKSKQQIRVVWHTIRLTEDEYQELKKLAAATICPNLSDYSRRVLLQQPVNVLSRNQSLDDFLADMLPLRRDLHQLCTFDQIIQQQRAANMSAGLEQRLLLIEQKQDRFYRLAETISNQIHEAHRLWSRV